MAGGVDWKYRFQHQTLHRALPVPINAIQEQLPAGMPLRHYLRQPYSFRRLQLESLLLPNLRLYGPAADKCRANWEGARPLVTMVGQECRWGTFFPTRNELAVGDNITVLSAPVLTPLVGGFVWVCNQPSSRVAFLRRPTGLSY